MLLAIQTAAVRQIIDFDVTVSDTHDVADIILTRGSGLSKPFVTPMQMWLVTIAASTWFPILIIITLPY